METQMKNLKNTIPTKENQMIEVDRIITLDVGDKLRVWQVTSVGLGSVRQEHIVGIRVLDKHNGVNGTKDIYEMFVPLDIINLVLKTEVEQDVAYRKETEWKNTK